MTGGVTSSTVVLQVMLMLLYTAIVQCVHGHYSESVVNTAQSQHASSKIVAFCRVILYKLTDNSGLDARQRQKFV